MQPVQGDIKDFGKGRKLEVKIQQALPKLRIGKCLARPRPLERVLRDLPVIGMPPASARIQMYSNCFRRHWAAGAGQRSAQAAAPGLVAAPRAAAISNKVHRHRRRAAVSPLRISPL